MSSKRSIFGKEIKRLNEDNSSKSADKKERLTYLERADDIMAELEESRQKLIAEEVALISGDRCPEELKQFALANLPREILHECIDFTASIEDHDYEIPPELTIPSLLKNNRMLAVVTWFDSNSSEPIATVARDLVDTLSTDRGDNYEQIYSDLIKGVAILYLTEVPSYEEDECEVPRTASELFIANMEKKSRRS